MKDYIISLLNDAISYGQDEKSANLYDIAFLKEIINKISNDKNYFYEFILDLSSDLLKELTANIEPASARDSFLASIVYLKNLTEINIKEEVKIPLSQNQEEILFELIELIKKIISEDDTKETEIQKYYKKFGKKYNDILNKFNNNIVLNIEDYELIEDLIQKNENGDLYKILNDVIDYLNIYNYRLLPKTNENTNMNESFDEEVEPNEKQEEAPK